MSAINIGFIGSGNIAGAIVGGITKNGYIKPENIYIYDVSEENAKKFTRFSVNISKSSREIMDECEVVFLTVKPQIYDVVLPEIAPFVKFKTIVSVAAGKTIATVKSFLKDASIIRVMPNTPMLVGKGATTICCEPSVQADIFKLVKGMFSASGVCVEIPEPLMNVTTAVGGSMPAFVYKFIRGAIDAAVRDGMNEKDARALVAATVEGAAVMVLKSEDGIDDMIGVVASPGGTTIAGMDALDQNKFEETVAVGVSAAARRAAELSGT